METSKKNIVQKYLYGRFISSKFRMIFSFVYGNDKNFLGDTVKVFGNS